MEGLLGTFLNVISFWDKSFPSGKSRTKAKLLAISLLITIGRKTISRALMASKLDHVDWSAAYKFFSRTRWSPCDLFRANLKSSIALLGDGPISIAWDDTLIKKVGKRILGTSWQRDSLSPPWRVNFTWGFRILQASLLLPLYDQKQSKPCRGIPVQFCQLPKHKRPPKRAGAEAHAEYERLQKLYNASTTFVKQLRYMRKELNKLGLKSRKLIASVDGSYTNKTTFNHGIEGVSIIGRTRKNARFFGKVKVKKGKQFYTEDSETAEEIRRNPDYKYSNARIHYGGDWREVRYKEKPEVYQKYSTRKKKLRLIIVAPTPYRRNSRGKLEYRDPAYLLTDDFETEAVVLIQKFFDRWQIEVNFKDEKGQMSLGKQQNWSRSSIEKTPAFIVASYGALMLAGVLHFSEDRSHPDFEKLPKWRNREGKRPSFSDFLVVLRKEIERMGGIKFENSFYETDLKQLALKAIA